MKIGIISDIHDNIPNALKAVKFFNEQAVGLVVFCGDWVSPFMPDFFRDLKCKITSVFGNNEGDIYVFLRRKEQQNWDIELHKRIIELEVEGRLIGVYHGDAPPITTSLLESGRFDAVFTGHTHIPLLKQHGKTLHVNPGTCSFFRAGELIDDASVAVYDTETNTAEIHYLE